MSDDNNLDDAELHECFDSLSDQGPSAGADTVLEGARADAARHRRNRRVAVSGVAAVIVLAIVVAAVGLITRDDEGGGIAVPGPEAVPENAIVLSLQLDAGEVAAGVPLTGRLVIDNTTGQPVELADSNGCAVKWAVHLDPIAPFNPASLGPGFTDECTLGVEIAEGRSEHDLTIATTYTACDPTEPTGAPVMAQCLPDGGMPPLPVGTYLAELVFSSPIEKDSTGQFPVITPDPLQVELVPPGPVLTFTFELDEYEVAAGETVTGRLVVRNLTGGVVELAAADGCGLRWAVAIIEGSGELDLGFSDECIPPVRLEPGTTVTPLAVRAVAHICRGVGIDEISACPTGDGRSLTPGTRYRVHLYLDLNVDLLAVPEDVVIPPESTWIDVLDD